MRADEVKTSAGREGRRPEEDRGSAVRPFAHGGVHGWKTWPCASFCGPPSAAVRIFFCTVVFGQRQQRGGLLGILPGAGGRCRRFRPPPALPRRLPRDAERMRAAREPRRFAALWTQARRLPCRSRPHRHRIRRYLRLGAVSSAPDARLWNRIRRFGFGRGVFNVCVRPCLLGIGHGFFVCLFSSSGCGIPHADAPRPQRARRCGIGAPFPASGSAFPEPAFRGGYPAAFPPAPDAGRPSGGEGLGGGSRSGFFSCANRGSGCFKECFLENQCIMEGSHRLSCGKTTMRPTHTNRPTT